MRNTWSLPGRQRVTHCSDHTPSARARPAVRGSPPFPAACPTFTGNDGPPPLPPAVQQRPGLRKPGCRALTPRRRRRRAGPARLLTPASGAGLLAALRGTGAPGSAPAASRGRPPPGAGPAAAALRTPPARRQRQQLPPRCPSSYFSDGSSRCCLGKRFFSPCQKQISYISSVHIDRAEVKCLLFLVDSKRN